MQGERGSKGKIYGKHHTSYLTHPSKQTRKKKPLMETGLEVQKLRESCRQESQLFEKEPNLEQDSLGQLSGHSFTTYNSNVVIRKGRFVR